MTSEAVAGHAVCHPRNFSGRVVATRSDSNPRLGRLNSGTDQATARQVVMFWTEPLVL